MLYQMTDCEVFKSIIMRFLGSHSLLHGWKAEPNVDMTDKSQRETQDVETMSGEARIKREPNNMKDFAEDTMNELLGWYGYGKVGREDTQHLRVSVKQLTTPDKGSRDTPPTTSTDRNEGSPDEIPLAADEDSYITEVSQPTFTDDDETVHTCAWCQRRESRMLTLETSNGRRHFCSEQCFTHSRRASFKRNRMCDWCRHVRHTINFVDFQDGENQLQFCSDKCLNQYKMNIFCRETQEHLRSIPSGGKELAKAKTLTNSKQILITPDLWMKEDEQDTPLNLKAKKSPKDKKQTVTESDNKNEHSINSKRKRTENLPNVDTPNKEVVLNWDSIIKSSRSKLYRPTNLPSTKIEPPKPSRRLHSLLNSHPKASPSTPSILKSRLHSPSSSISSCPRQSPLQKTISPPSSITVPVPHVATSERPTLQRTPSVASSAGSSTPAVTRTPLPGQIPLHLPHPFMFPPGPPFPNLPFPLLPPNPFPPIVPPTTCLVPFPIVLPFPIPVPIPIPMEKDMWEALKKKASEQTTSKNQSEADVKTKTTVSIKQEISDHDAVSPSAKSESSIEPSPSSSVDGDTHSILTNRPITTNGTIPAKDTCSPLSSLPRPDHAYSLRRSLILDAPNVPRKRYRSPSPTGHHLSHKKRLNHIRVNNKL